VSCKTGGVLGESGSNGSYGSGSGVGLGGLGLGTGLGGLGGLGPGLGGLYGGGKFPSLYSAWFLNIQLKNISYDYTVR
jgi:hypothetical protein